jgi:hypothetical protein
MDLRPQIRATLWAGGLLLSADVVSGVLWLILLSAGDQAGSQAIKAIALLATVGFALAALVLLVLLALTELTRSNASAQDESHGKPRPKHDLSS